MHTYSYKKKSIIIKHKRMFKKYYLYITFPQFFTYSKNKFIF